MAIRIKCILLIRAVLIVASMILFIGVIVVANYRADAYQKELYCATPWTVPIQGKVIRAHDRVSVSGAEVTIRNLSPERSVCPDHVYLSEERLLTGQDGLFNVGKTAHPEQNYELTIKAPGCKTYSEEQPFSRFQYAEIDTEDFRAYRRFRVVEFVLECAN
jgi:hypothetical protein